MPQGAVVDAFVFVDKLETALKKSQDLAVVDGRGAPGTHFTLPLLIGLTDMFLFLSPR